MENDNTVYNDIILIFSILDDETRLEFLHGLKCIKDVQIEGLTPSTYTIRGGNVQFAYQEITEIIKEMKFSKTDFIVLVCSATFASDKVKPEDCNKLEIINVDLP